MSFVKDAYKKLVVGSINDTEALPDVDAWLAFLDSLPETADEVDCSYNKYLCRKWFISKPRLALLNLAALFMLLMNTPVLMRGKQPLPKAEEDKLVLLLFRDIPYTDVLPDQLVTRFQTLKTLHMPPSGDGAMCLEAKNLFKQCRRKHPFSFYYLFYVLKELSVHSKVLVETNPKAVAVYANERNIAGPILRKLYEDGGREFDSFMHGEYLLQLIQAFMSFTNYYVWDESYIDTFENVLKCECGTYTVYNPKRLTKKWNLEDVTPDHFCTYYFSGESEEAIRRTKEALSAVEAAGKKYLVRPHPRYSHYGLIRKYFEPGQIEWPTETSMEKSLGSTQYVVGLCSTVLMEAMVEGRTVVIDDLTEPVRFDSLQKRHYRLLQYHPLRLSDLVADVSRDGDGEATGETIG